MPVACLMNHSCRPHVVEYGRVTPPSEPAGPADAPADGRLRLDFRCMRPVPDRQQCFLS